MPRILISLLIPVFSFSFLYTVTASAEYYVVYSVVSYGSSCPDGCTATRTHKSYKGEGYSSFQSNTKRGCNNVSTLRPVSSYLVSPPTPMCPNDEWSANSCKNWQPGYWQGTSYITTTEQRFLHGSPDMTDVNDFDYDRRTADDISSDLNIDL